MSDPSISVALFDPTGATPAPEGLTDIWTRLAPLLSHWSHFNHDETKIISQQHGMIRDGCFMMPSPFSDTPDTCFRSYYHSHRFFYEFDSIEPYYWISSVLDRAYCLSALYFPHRQIAVTMYDYNIDASLIRQFAGFRAAIPSEPRPVMPSAGQRIVVAGWPHSMHMLWNELPALDAIAQNGLQDKLQLAITHEPFGPTAELFPRLAGSIRTLTYDDATALNRHNRFLVGLGAWTITPAVQQQVQRVALRNASPALVQTRDSFRSLHEPIFWLSVKPPNRTCLDQSAVLATLIASIRREYPRAGFLLNGVSLPWDYYNNPNYLPWFRASLQRASTASRQSIRDVVEQLPFSLRDAIAPVTDISLCDEIVWGDAADFYFCHGGTMQNKIGWVHRIPGMIHSNQKFLASFKGMPPPVLDGAPCFFLPPDATVDDAEANYTPDQLARKDQNYRFTSLDKVAAAVLEAFAASRT